jgi:hypothetical protein
MKMSAKDTDTREWSDPKDYGLPFVEITPLKPQQVIQKEKQEVNLKKPVISEKKLVEPVKEPITVSEEKPKAESAQIKDLPKPKVEKKEKSNAWVWMVVGLALVVLGVIVWQLQLNRSEVSPIETSSAKPEEKIVENQSVPIEETTVTDTAVSDGNQEVITSTNNSNPNLSKPAETGTTIANTVRGNLIRIESKAEKVRYFIVVASLPNEQLALELAEKFEGKSQERFLITPYESSPNYRIAIGKFDTWKAAADEVARIKSQYSEDLWILNY